MARTDVVGIKDTIKSLFDSANTTTASPIDLSSDLTKRVQKTMTLHPDMIRPQASFFPFVTCYVDDKAVVSKQIAVNQTTAKRDSEITLKIVGAVFNQNLTDVTKDPADNDINYLMENIEQVLRSNPNLSGKVLWQAPESVEYFTTADLSNAVRYGILTLKARVSY